MRCRSFRDLVSQRMDERLPAGELDAFEAHRRDCPSCAGFLEQMERCCHDARRVTEIIAPEGFDDTVMAALNGQVRTFADGLAPARRSSLFSLRSAVAGLIIGVAVGVAVDIAMRASNRGAGSGPVRNLEAPASSLWGRDVELGDSASSEKTDYAQAGLGGFLQASEFVGSGINALPWNDTFGNGMLLGSLAQRIEMDKKIEEAERARPVLGRSNPQGTAVLSELIQDQRDILDLLHSPRSISPEVVKNMRAKALNTLGNIQRAREEFGVIRVIRLAPGPGRQRPEPENDMEALTGAMMSEVEGDFNGAIKLYLAFPEKFPTSQWKSLMIGRGVRIGQQLGRTDVVLQLLEAVPRYLEPGELDSFTSMQIQTILNQLDGIDREKKVNIRMSISLLAQARPEEPSMIGGLKIDGRDIPVDVRNRGLVYSLWNALRRQGGWSCLRSTEYADGAPRIDRTTFERQASEKMDLRVEIYLRKLLSGAGFEAEPSSVLKIDFEGR